MDNLKVTFPLVYNDRRSTLSIQPVAEQQDGYLKYTDWKEFKEKVSTDRAINTKAPLFAGGDLSANREIYISKADSQTDGYIIAEDYRDFKSKYPFPKGLLSQYLKGDGSIGNYVRHTETAGTSLTYYLNSQGNGIIANMCYFQLGSVPNIQECGHITYSNISGVDGVICGFITDIGSPNQLVIPKGRWSLDVFASATNLNNNISIYV
jgi:hypothetical protein